jgi:hypothetical protein
MNTKEEMGKKEWQHSISGREDRKYKGLWTVVGVQKHLEGHSTLHRELYLGIWPWPSQQALHKEFGSVEKFKQWMLQTQG